MVKIVLLHFHNFKYAIMAYRKKKCYYALIYVYYWKQIVKNWEQSKHEDFIKNTNGFPNSKYKLRYNFFGKDKLIKCSH